MKVLKRISLVFSFLVSLSLAGHAQSGTILTFAGNGTRGFSGDGGPATSAQLDNPTGLAVDTAGNLYIADFQNYRIRKVTAAGVISTLAGNGTAGFSGDGGPATAAQLYSPPGVAVDLVGNLYIADFFNYRIRKVTAAGVISTIAGNGTPGFSGDGGPATAASLNFPESVAVDTAGNLYIADSANQRIRRVTPDGVINTVAGNGAPGFSGDGGPATAAQLNSPSGLVVDSTGNLYIADRNNHRIRKVTADGVIGTVAGDGTGDFSGDGGPATLARLNSPTGLAADSSGNLYIADRDNFRIRKVTPANASSVFFPQIPVGGGYSTLFTITNTGATVSAGNLTLRDQQGNPFTVNAQLTDSSGTAQPPSPGSNFALTVPAGGTVFLSVTGLVQGGPTRAGWAQLDSTGGSLSAVATYEYSDTVGLRTRVGVLHSRPLRFATMPVNNDTFQNEQTAYAIANPGNQSILVNLVLVGQDGRVVDDSVTLAIGPGQQIARYVWQDLSRLDFKGSLVLRGQAGATFVAVALSDKQGFLTAIPLIPEKTPGVPD